MCFPLFIYRSRIGCVLWDGTVVRYFCPRPCLGTMVRTKLPGMATGNLRIVPHHGRSKGAPMARTLLSYTIRPKKARLFLPIKKYIISVPLLFCAACSSAAKPSVSSRIESFPLCSAACFCASAFALSHFCAGFPFAPRPSFVSAFVFLFRQPFSSPAMDWLSLRRRFFVLRALPPIPSVSALRGSPPLCRLRPSSQHSPPRSTDFFFLLYKHHDF